MNFQEHTTPEKLERYSFLYLLLTLAFTMLTLFSGGYPIITRVFDYTSGIYSILQLCWLVAGASAGYLAYQFYKHDKKVFGGTESKQVVFAFYFALALGINLGLTAILRDNIFFNILYGQIVYIVFGIASAASAYFLYTAWKAHGETLFGNKIENNPVVTPVVSAPVAATTATTSAGGETVASTTTTPTTSRTENNDADGGDAGGDGGGGGD